MGQGLPGLFECGTEGGWVGMNEIQHVHRQQQDDVVTNVVTISVTADYTRLLLVTLPAFHLMNDVLKLLDDLSASPV